MPRHSLPDTTKSAPLCAETVLSLFFVPFLSAQQSFHFLQCFLLPALFYFLLLSSFGFVLCFPIISLFQRILDFPVAFSAFVRSPHTRFHMPRLPRSSQPLPDWKILQAHWFQGICLPPPKAHSFPGKGPDTKTDSLQGTAHRSDNYTKGP